MAKKITREFFIKKASEIHHHIDFSGCIYTNTETKINAICSRHGLFYREPKKILNRGGCPKCSYEAIAKKNSKTKEQFVSEVIKAHGDIFDFSESDYNGVLRPISAVCKKHGLKTVIARSILTRGCTDCNSEKKKQESLLKNKARLVEKYSNLRSEIDFTILEYRGSQVKTLLRCKKHGEFEIAPASLSTHGCPKCGNERRGLWCKLTQDEFIERALSIHGHRYDYSETVYTRRADIISIKCNTHGKFKQRANDHLSGNGCQKCASDLGIGFKRDSFLRVCQKREKDKANLYLIKCFDDNEVFYKVGITYRSLKYRFSGISRLPYNYSVISTLSISPIEAWNGEKDIHKKLKEHKYKPSKKFGGSFECFSKLTPEVLDFFGVKDEAS